MSVWSALFYVSAAVVYFAVGATLWGFLRSGRNPPGTHPPGSIQDGETGGR